MKEITFNKELSEKEHITWQLRFIYPKLSWEDLDKLYWIWKTPDYINFWIQEGITKNLFSGRVAEQRLIEYGLLIDTGQLKEIEEGGKIKRGKRAKVRTLDPQIKNILSTEHLKITFNLKNKEND